MICKYCRLICTTDAKHPLRRATKDIRSDYPRCDWHWRFVCNICGNPRHFNGVTWCAESGKFFCLRCAKRHRIVPHKFWTWTNYYSLECPQCGRNHPALDYLEFVREHPWQLHPSMKRQKQGLDPALEVKETPAEYVPFERAASETKISKAWDRLAHQWADGYTEYGDLNRQYVIDPVILRLIGPVKGLRILDAGCGNGYFCRLLAKRGAQVVGIDISSKFIKMAKQKEKELPLGITYRVGSVCNIEMCQDDAFEIVVSNLALMDLPDLNKALEELNRVLKRKGRLVFSIMHPCFASPPVHGWVRMPFDTDRKEDRIYWKVDRYFDKTMEIWRLSEGQTPLYSFHRPLSEYITTLLKHGFKISDFEEPVPSKKAIREHYREFGDEYTRVPWFLIIGACKQ